jgi:predicted membrane chloride channel (bestrophin family)
LADDLAFALKQDDELTNSELVDIEARRRDILRRTELPIYKILGYWDGTCIRILIFDPLIWITVLLYVLVRIKCRFELPDELQDTVPLSGNNISVIGGFLSFFLVFFVVSSNSRFHDQYNLCMAAKGRIFDVASMAQASLPRDMGLRMVRRMNASNVVAYVGLSNTYTSTNLFPDVNKAFKLLSAEEYKRVMELDMDAGGCAYREIVAWCQHDVSTALREGIIDSRLASQLRDKLLDFQAAFGGLYNFADQPISFFYVHFISLLSALYLPLFAVSSAFGAGIGAEVPWTADVVNGLIVVLQSIFVVGLRQLGQNMSDPLGSDLEDLSVLHYVHFTWRMSNRIMGARPPPVSATIEDDIVRERESIGAAWEDGDKAEKSSEGAKAVGILS